MSEIQKHVITAMVQNSPGVLAHVAGMFAARGFNIDSLVVGRTENPEISRMTIVAIADDRILEQVRKQLAKIISVLTVKDFTGVDYVERDLMLIRVKAPAEKRGQIMELTNLFRGWIVDVSPETVMVELTGSEQKIESFIEMVAEYGIVELARTGVIAMPRGRQKNA